MQFKYIGFSSKLKRADMKGVQSMVPAEPPAALKSVPVPVLWSFQDQQELGTPRDPIEF